MSESASGKQANDALGAKPVLSKPVIGLIGGIGAGKSRVARVFQEQGAAVIDSDRLAHAQLADAEVLAALVSWWGKEILDERGKVDRKAVGHLVFSDEEKLKRLEELIYPRLERIRRNLCVAYDTDPSVRAVVLDSPKLMEAGIDRFCDAVVFVDTDRAVRLERLKRTRGWTEEEMVRREKLQNPLDIKKARAEYTIENNSGLTELETNVKKTLASILASFNRR